MKAIISVESVVSTGYKGIVQDMVLCSFGCDDPQAEWGSRGFMLPPSRFPTVVRNRINKNMIIIFCVAPEEIENLINNPDLIPLEEAVYFEMIWKAR